MLADYSHILSRFHKLRPCRREATWAACCPVHGDRQPSMRIWVGKNGCLVARCWANKGCTFRQIAEAVNTRPADWFPPADTDTERGRRKMGERKIVAAYDYRDEGGRLLYQVVRYEPKDFRQRRPDGKGGWLWDLEGVERVPYRLPEILARPEQPVIVVEGEKDADTLAALGFLATTNAGGAGKWTRDLGGYFKGRRVAVLPDNDAPGRDHAALVAGCLLVHGAASVRVVHLPYSQEKDDVTDYLADFPKGPDAVAKKRAALAAQIRSVPEWAAQGRAA